MDKTKEMSIKMCSVSELKTAGYETEVSEAGRCPSKSMFLAMFTKSGYELSLPDRGVKQLFPLSGIVETHIIQEPSLEFAKTELETDFPSGTISNSFTYSNLEGPWTVEIASENIAGHVSVTVDAVNKVVNVVCAENTDTTKDYECTVRLTGTRTDGTGTYSGTFTLTQGTYYYTLNITNNAVLPETSSGEASKFVVDGSVLSTDDAIEFKLSSTNTSGVTISCNYTWYFNLETDVRTVDNDYRIARKVRTSKTITYSELESLYPNHKGELINIFIKNWQESGS